jgi:hypothetical protein
MEGNRRGAKARRVGRGRVLVTTAAAIAVVSLAAGCAKHEDEQVAAGAGADQAVVVAQSTTPLGAAHGTGQTGTAGAPGEGLATSSADSLPPDVAVTVADTLVYPGGSVEITAAASSDVVGVTLWDGVGRKQPFVYDEETDTWKVFYRVPMKASTDRVALSVTARNAPQRWRRVWLFLNVQHEAAAVQPDSSAGR